MSPRPTATRRELRRVARLALDLSIRELNSAGRLTPCQRDPSGFLADDADARAEGVGRCLACPVRRLCGAYATAAAERFGVWGGRDRSAHGADQEAS